MLGCAGRRGGGGGIPTHPRGDWSEGRNLDKVIRRKCKQFVYINMSDKINLGFLKFEEFIQRRSVTLINNPESKLDQKFEVENYLSKLNPGYLNEIESSSLLDTQPLSEKARIIVTIIAYNEGSRIRKTLDNYLNQDIDPSLFEIVILDNHPQSIERDNTFYEVQSFKNNNPSLSIIYAHKVWAEGEYATVGNARKYVFDIATMRVSKRLQAEYETILISNDADTVSLETNYLSSILSEFDTNQTTDALVTLSVVPLSAILKPNLYAVLSLWDALDGYVANREPYNLKGSTSAFRTSIYTAVGGFNSMSKMAEDLEIGWLIADARNWDTNSVIQFKKTKHVQDPRRILMATASRIPVNEMYYDFVAKPEIRNADNDTLLSLIPNSLDWELFQEDADSFWQGRTTGMYKWRGERFTFDFKQAMDKIGAEFEIINDRVRLKKLEKLVLNYTKDFGETITIARSEERKWDPVRQAKMKKFFSSISDSIIAARNKMAEKVLSQIKNSEAEGNTAETNHLLREYRRFAGSGYDSERIT